jgi:hypothetical protein
MRGGSSSSCAAAAATAAATAEDDDDGDRRGVEEEEEEGGRGAPGDLRAVDGGSPPEEGGGGRSSSPRAAALTPEAEADADASGSDRRRRRLAGMLRRAARALAAEQDPWKHHGMERIPAERAARWFYDRPTASWSSDETVVKIQSEPFTRGAMRSCYRLKKRACPPREATNTRFHRFGWKTSGLNYVAKAYLCPATGDVDCSERAKRQVRNDVVLQHEAQHWADRFNSSGPPAQIMFLRAYAVEFTQRPGRPWMAVERYIAGKDSYGASFVKHNTNAGFVDRQLRRVTPQVFSAHTFYASGGTREFSPCVSCAALRAVKRERETERTRKSAASSLLTRAVLLLLLTFFLLAFSSLFYSLSVCLHRQASWRTFRGWGTCTRTRRC